MTLRHFFFVGDDFKHIWLKSKKFWFTFVAYIHSHPCCMRSCDKICFKKLDYCGVIQPCIWHWPQYAIDTMDYLTWLGFCILLLCQLTTTTTKGSAAFTELCELGHSRSWCQLQSNHHQTRQLFSTSDTCTTTKLSTIRVQRKMGLFNPTPPHIRAQSH